MGCAEGGSGRELGTDRARRATGAVPYAAGVPTSLAAVRALVSARIPEALDEHTAGFAASSAPLKDLLAPARRLLTGGKRLRALLAAVGWTAARTDATPEDPAVVHAGAALELFQAAALVHDDVMDGSLERRGMPAAHRQLAAEHARRGWLGSPDVYGVAGAVLLGDLLLTVASMELDVARAGTPGSERARRIYDDMVGEVAYGQFLDMRAQALPWDQPGSAVERALEVVRHKSARYSVEHPLALGAALAGADDDLLGKLRRVGLPLGEAFQLRDDHLGVFGSPAETGKPAGDDLREGKRTVLVALALERADAAGRELLRSSLGRPDLTAAEVDRLRGLLDSCGAVEAHESLIAERYEAGRSAIAAAGLRPAVRAELEHLADALVRRRA